VAVILGQFDIEVSAEDQGKAFDIVASILATIGAGMALVSKYREKQRDDTCHPDPIRPRQYPDPKTGIPDPGADKQ
jgi:hypothetical protein